MIAHLVKYMKDSEEINRVKHNIERIEQNTRRNENSVNLVLRLCDKLGIEITNTKEPNPQMTSLIMSD